MYRMLQVAELQQNYSDWLSQQAGEQDAAHEMQRALREAQGDSQTLRHNLNAAQQQHSRAEAKYHSKVGWPARVTLSGRLHLGAQWIPLSLNVLHSRFACCCTAKEISRSPAGWLLQNAIAEGSQPSGVLQVL